MRRKGDSLVAVLRDVVLLSISFAPRDVAASEAMWMQPSGNWLGIDGTWSTFSFGVGSPAQAVQLIPSTYLSETWVIETSGCPQIQECYDDRGGPVNISRSSTWQPFGAFQLGLDDVRWGGYGDYGLDSMIWTNTFADQSYGIKGAFIAGINDTNYYQGYLGLGISQSKLNNNITSSFLLQMVQTFGIVPSYSYGYTAGAHYMHDGGTVASLVFGGYDPQRFVMHDTNFTLNSTIRVPTVILRGITAKVSSRDRAPASNWNSTEQPLVTMQDSLNATIDSSTPYLWLPPAICDRFAETLNLTWSDNFGAYLFQDGAQYTAWANNTDLSFTFSLSSFDNSNNFGSPLNMDGVVNITVSAMAFAQLFRYPFKNLFTYTEPDVPYFPLKRSNGTDQIIIGRAFLQEAYLLMRYDEGKFSVHQAQFPTHATSNFTVHTIPRPADSVYPAYAGPEPSPGLSSGQKVGIVLSALASVCSIGLLIWWCCRRQRKKRRVALEAGREGGLGGAAAAANKEETESVDSEQPMSPVRRMFSIIVRRKKSRRPVHAQNQAGGGGPHGYEVHGNDTHPVEVGADAHNAIYELAAPMEPHELDSPHDDDLTELGTEGSSQGLSAYEIARRKIERQLQGPVPTYTPPTVAFAHQDDEKGMQDVSPMPHYRPPSPRAPPPATLRTGETNRHAHRRASPSPVSSPTYATSTDTGNNNSLPSPMTPYPVDWNRTFDLPSPMAVVSPAFPSPPFSSSSSSGGGSRGSNNAPRSVPSMQFPRSPTDPSSAGGASVVMSRSDSDNISPVSPGGSGSGSGGAFGRAAAATTGGAASLTPSTPVQRNPIDPSRVICLGPLPNNVRLPRAPPISPSLVAPGRSRTGADSPHPDSLSRPELTPHREHGLNDTFGSEGTLGSNFTEEEDDRIRQDEMTRQQQQQQQQTVRHPHPRIQLPGGAGSTFGGDVAQISSGRAEEAGGDFPHSPQSMERIEATCELVHVPQVAEKRYSWEEERK